MKRTGQGLAGLIIVLSFSGAARAQEVKDKQVLTLAERQEKAKKELNKLLQRMREIADRLRKRGEEHQARKLEEAFGKIQETGLLSDMRSVVETLKRARLWEAIDQQKEIVGKIDKVLDILLDRKSFEELEKNAEDLDRIQKKLKDLIEEEDKHIEKITELEREGRKAVPEDVKEVAKAVDDLVASQRALMQRTKAADMGENLKRAEKALADLSKLASEQQELLEKVENIEGLTQEEAKLLEKALMKLDDLVEMQEKAAEAASLEGTTPDLDAVSEALEKIRKDQEALEAANRADAEKSGKTGLHQAQRDLRALMEKQRAVKELTRAAGELAKIQKKQAEVSSRAGKDPQWAREQAGMQGKSAEAAKMISNSLKRAMENPSISHEDREKLLEASENAKSAAEALKQASRSAADGADDASEKAKKALEALEKSAEALAPVLGEGWKKLEKSQKELAAEAEKVAGQIALSPDSASRVDPEAAAKRAEASKAMKSATEKMRNAREQISQKNPGGAQGKQSEALGQLNNAHRIIGNLLEQATAEGRDIAENQMNLGRQSKGVAGVLKKASHKKPGGQEGKVGSSLKRAAEKASEAASRQETAASNVLQGNNHEGGLDQKRAAQALAEAQKALAEATAKAAGKEGRADLADSQAKASKGSSQVGKNLSRAAETLKSRGASGRGQKMAELASQMQKASAAAKQAGDASKTGKSGKAAAQSKAALDSMKKARQELADFLKKSRPRTEAEAKAQAALRDRAQKIGDELAAMGREQATMPGRKQAQDAARAMSSAGRKMAEAARQLDEGNPREAEVKEKDALKDLDKAKKLTEDLKRRLLNKSEPQREMAAKQQLRLKERAEKVKEMLEKLEQKSSSSSSSSSSSGKKKASKSMSKAGQNMKKAAESLVKRNFPKSKQEQQEALKAMEEARREVKKLEDQAIRKAKERELNALVREQKGTEEKTKLTKEELEKLKRLMEARQMEQAARAMNQAKHKVSNMELRPGKQKMEQARDYLKEAEAGVREQQRKYAALAQEQLIFQIKTLLKDVLTEQKKINGTVEEMGARVDNGRRLQRGHVRRLLQSADEQVDLAKRMREIEKKIEKDARVFSWVVQSTVEDMNSIADLLRDRPPDVGPFTRGLGREVESRISELLEAFKLELKRRQKPPPKKQPPGQGGPRRPRLVPALAELQMLRTLQGQIRGNTESLLRIVKDGRELSPVQMMILERLVHRQGNVTDVMRSFIQSLEGQSGEQGSRR
ncbi:MAG: hypothetical protein ACYTFG_00365 [Planctomycetota bacterium]|jgi:hypothetical protein